MFSALQAACGTWPSDSSHTQTRAFGIQEPSGLNERMSFGNDGQDVPSASSDFVLTPESHATGKVFIPPYFVPPGDHAVELRDDYIARTLRDALRQQARSGSVLAAGVEGGDSPAGLTGHALFDPSIDPAQLFQEPSPDVAVSASRHRVPRSVDLQHDNTAPNLVSHQRLVPGGNNHPRTSSLPPYGSDIDHERELNWSDSAHRAFNAMVHAPGYVNRYRLSADKYHRLRKYLRDPTNDPLLEDGSKDHQTKYQAMHWVLRGGKLHREVAGKVVGGSLRRHLDLDETWDVLTAEHLRSGHLGRDRLRKMLERKYIGYTLQEIMFVLRECKRCNGLDKSIDLAEVECDMAASENSEPDAVDEVVSRLTQAPPKRQQASNWMWF